VIEWAIQVGSIKSNWDITKDHPFLLMTQAAVSALCGNMGLQTGSATTRALDTNTLYGGTWWKHSGREIMICFLLAVSAAFCQFVLIGYCIGNPMLPSYDERWIQIAASGAISMTVSGVVAGICGFLAPLCFHNFCGWDPVLCAGPFETAIQDLFGISFMQNTWRLLYRSR
jgi:Mg/Co/Ni transporter MgtE